MRRHLGEDDEPEDTEIDITPMLDVVFILLIFFIVTATFVKESGLDANRPDASSAPPPPEDEDMNIIISIDQNDGVWVNRRKTDIRRVSANIERYHAENPEATVVIIPAKESKTDTLIRVMDASREANVYAISISNPD